MMALF
jgi:hypothetical protein